MVLQLLEKVRVCIRPAGLRRAAPDLPLKMIDRADQGLVLGFELPQKPDTKRLRRLGNEGPDLRIERLIFGPRMGLKLVLQEFDQSHKTRRLDLPDGLPGHLAKLKEHLAEGFMVANETVRDFHSYSIRS